MLDRDNRTGPRLPKVLRDEIGLSSSAGPRRKPNPHWQSTDRKAQRKQQRQERKTQQSRSQTQHKKYLPAAPAFSDDTEAADAAPVRPQKGGPPPAEPTPAPAPVKSILKKSKKRPVSEVEEVEEQARPRKNKRQELRKAVRDKLAEDDAEIEHLERKLKIKDKKLPKGFQEEGLDWLLEGLKDDYLDDRQERAAKRNRIDRFSRDDGDGESEDESEDGENDESDEEEDGEEDGLDDILHEDDSSSSEEFAGISSPSLPPPKEPPKPVRQDPTKPFVAEGKYVPPSLRKSAITAAGASESEELVRLRRQTQGLINRLSESNLLSILTEIENLYRSHARGHVTSVLCDILLGTVTDRAALLDTFLILHAGFVAGVYKVVGVDFGAEVVQRLVTEFEKYYDVARNTDDVDAGKECANLMGFLSDLYTFGVVGCGLVFDYVRMFLKDITELHTELLLKIVRTSGQQLRTDDPAVLKDLLSMLHSSIAATGAQNLSVRTKFMVETLSALKNNRMKKDAAANSAVAAEHTVRMRKLLGSLNARRLRASEPLRAGLDDIKNTDSRGKWWLVGASWAGNDATASASRENGTYKDTGKEDGDEQAQAEREEEGQEDDEEDATPDLDALARAHRMNTAIRRSIFITLLSAADYSDAHARLLKLRLKRSQQPEIPRVLLHCAASEATYNPYYTALARVLCAQSHHSRMAFTFALWSYFRRFSSSSFDEEEEEDEEDWSSPASLRKVVNLARLYGTLAAQEVGGMGVTLLKTLEFVNLGPAETSWLEVFLRAVLVELGGERARVMAWVGKATENGTLVRGLLWWVRKKGDGVRAVAGGEGERKMVKKGLRAITEALEEAVRSGGGGEE